MPVDLNAPRTERLSVSVPPDLVQLLERYASVHGKSVSQAVADFLIDGSEVIVALTKLGEHTNRRRAKALGKLYPVASA
jgi:hypothetical protein